MACRVLDWKLLNMFPQRVKKNMHELEEKVEKNLRIGIVVSEYYSFISDGLLAGALDVLDQDERVIATKVIRISGAWEIPAIVKSMAECDKYEGIIALGCVIRGQTSHFDYICEQVSLALMTISLDHKLPVGFGILTVDNVDQAKKRSTYGEPNNKGVEAAEAVVGSAIEIELLKQEF